jgi:hypothetical protein
VTLQEMVNGIGIAKKVATAITEAFATRPGS